MTKEEWTRRLNKEVRNLMNECVRCGFNDEDYGCTCPSCDKWYACPIESRQPENQQALKEYAEREGRYDET